MADYISREAALNFEWEIECEPDALQPMMEGMARVMDYIKKLPAADVVEVDDGASRNVCERPPISQGIKTGEKSTCWSCFHWAVCFAKKNQPCVRCSRYFPAADVVEVVRCKDCKYSDTFSDECEPTEFPLKCLSIRYGGVYQDWFCEHGRRREDGDADDKR